MSERSEKTGSNEKAAVLKPPVLTDIQVEAFGRETGEPGWMVDARRAAFEIYRRAVPPQAGEDAWRHSDLLRFPFADLNLAALAVSGKGKRVPSAWLKPAAGARTGGQLVLDDRAVHTRMLAEPLAAAGVIFQPLAQAAKEHPDLIRGLLGSVVAPTDGFFAALAAIIYDVGYVLHVPKGVRIAEPLQAVLWSSGEGLRALRVLVNVEEGASVSLLHECASPARTDAAVRMEIFELNVHPEASLDFVLAQSWGGNIVRIAHERAVVGQNGRLSWAFAHLGGRNAKVFSSVDLKGEGASTRWSGLNFLEDCQQADFATSQNHLAPKTTSDFLYKGVLTGRTTAMWRGMVRVAPDAAGSDGYQGNRTLMLSDRAVAESIPGLEILSDDVRCSHGVTIGELDPEELFYLRSRGISEPEAQQLLVAGFLASVLERIPEEGIRDRVQLAVEGKMKTMEAGWIAAKGTSRPDNRPEPEGAIS
jgi:Fe-S cluster assembly protein SufD